MRMEFDSVTIKYDGEELSFTRVDHAIDEISTMEEEYFEGAEIVLVESRSINSASEEPLDVESVEFEDLESLSSELSKIDDY